MIPENENGSHAADALKLGRSVGLLGGIALVVGGVIGMGIYALIAAVGAQAGTGLWVAFLLAIFISGVGVAPLIQIVSALPRAGGGYLFTSRLLHPLIGTLASCWAIFGGTCMTAMVALGLAGYIAPYLPGSPPVRLVAFVLPILFYTLFLFGLRLAASVQMLLVAQLIVALLVYGLSGAFSFDLSLAVDMPRGIDGLIMATILCYSVCMGFQVIAEMGEEIKTPRRNIPLALVIGGSIVLLVYILVGTVFINSLPYDFNSIGALTAPLMDSGKRFLSGFWVLFLSIGALSAGLTSFNAGAIALPRELLAQARDGILPRFLERVHPRTRTPLNAVTVYFVLMLALILTGRSIDFYGVVTAVGILMMTATISIAAVRLPNKFPRAYAKAYFHIPRGWLIILAAVSVVSSLGFVFIVTVEMPAAGLIYVILSLAVAVYYFLRVRWLKHTGVDWERRVLTVPGDDG
ncbi:MAG: amino acid permease [Deltaproteobacteria bacterium]|nr:amino acid permease [Deltaproteobacteria bacterium]